VVGSCKRGNETEGFLKCGDVFLTSCGTKIFKKDFAS
jgi:hypothetical protein